MTHVSKLIAVVALASLVGGCSDYLSGPGVGNDPNNIEKLVRPGPLYIGIQAAQAVQFQSQLARNAAMYVQQVAGNSRQQIGYDRYTIDPLTIDPYWTSVFGSSRVLNGGGGLLDIRKMQQLARTAGDSLYIGIAKVYEALVMGTAADIWGDVPYRQAADSTILTPAFDPQLQVYADLQAQLDSAITIYLPATGPTNLGPPQDNAELIYRGLDAAGLRATYLQVAHSLKARLYLHTAEVDPTSYAKALAEVPLGISSPANDFNWFADATPNGNNLWWQFMATRGDIGPGAAMIDVMKRRIAAGIADSARLNFYFQPATNDSGAVLGWAGFRPGGATNLQVAPGIDPGNGITDPVSGNPFYSNFNFINPNTDPGDFRQPEITYDETQLIGAEAAFRPVARVRRSRSSMPPGPTGYTARAAPRRTSSRRSRRRRQPCRTSWRRSTRPSFSTSKRGTTGSGPVSRRLRRRPQPAAPRRGRHPLRGDCPTASPRSTPTRTRRTYHLRGRTLTIRIRVRC